MKLNRLSIFPSGILGFFILLICFSGCATKLPQAQNPSVSGLQPPFRQLGQIKPKHARDIASSTWSIGGETLDRDYTDYHSYKKYLGPLGAKGIRLQGGWAKTEKVKGQYDFGWLDAIVQDAYAQGVAPWIEFSYGNPIYEGGGLPKLASDLPRSAEAKAAWDAWVKAMVNRYKGQVTEWEIWNEPDIARSITGEDYADFYIHTAELVRAIQPEAKLMAFGLADVNKVDYVEALFKKLQQQQKLNLVDILTYHGYKANPDESYPEIERLRAMVHRYKPEVVFMQGENGAPSTPSAVTIGALKEHDWSELSQAKWNLRRMLGDHGRGISTNLFTISDMHYAAGDHMVGVNTKGILKTHPDKTIDRPKLAYYAAQHVFTLFDDQLELLQANAPEVKHENIAAFGYRHKGNGKSLISLWSNEARPAELYEPRLSTVMVEGSFSKPVLVDLISGMVYEIPEHQWEKSGIKHTFTQIPIPDYPIVIADISTLSLK